MCNFVVCWGKAMLTHVNCQKWPLQRIYLLLNLEDKNWPSLKINPCYAQFFIEIQTIWKQMKHAYKELANLLDKFWFNTNKRVIKIVWKCAFSVTASKLMDKSTYLHHKYQPIQSSRNCTAADWHTVISHRKICQK